MAIRRSIAAAVASAWLVPVAVAAVPMVAIDRFGQFLPIGTLVAFDSLSPQNGHVVGATGLREVGAMDARDDELFVPADAGGVIGFYRVDPATGASTLVSRTTRPTQIDRVYGGSFDDQGRFWLSLQAPGSSTDLLAFDPDTGEELITFHNTQGMGVFAGLAFVGPTLYALTSSRFGTVSLVDGHFTAIPVVGGHPCSGGSMGLDDEGNGTLLFTCSKGSLVGPDSLLYGLDPLSGIVSPRGDVIPHGTFDAIAAIPEPASSDLVAAGLTFLGVRARQLAVRRRTRPTSSAIPANNESEASGSGSATTSTRG
jgi:hypothetical protein